MSVSQLVIHVNATAVVVVIVVIITVVAIWLKCMTLFPIPLNLSNSPLNWRTKKGIRDNEQQRNG